MIKNAVVPVLILMIFSTAPVFTEPAFKFGSRKHLFIDDELIDYDKSKNINIIVNPPSIRKRVITPDKPWETIGSHYFSQVMENRNDWKHGRKAIGDVFIRPFNVWTVSFRWTRAPKQAL